MSCRLWFDSESGQTNDFKIGIHSFLLDAQHQRDSVEIKPASLLVVPLEKALIESQSQSTKRNFVLCDIFIESLFLFLYKKFYRITKYKKKFNELTS